MASHSYTFWHYFGAKSLRDAAHGVWRFGAGLLKPLFPVQPNSGRRLGHAAGEPNSMAAAVSASLGEASPEITSDEARPLPQQRPRRRPGKTWRQTIAWKARRRVAKSRFKKTVKASPVYVYLVPVRRFLSPFLRLLRRNLFHIRFNSLLRRIIFTNLVGLLVFLAGIMWLDQYRARLMGVKAASLFSQGEMIARTIAWAAAVKTDEVNIGPESIFDAQSEAGEFAATGGDPLLEGDARLNEFPIDPERAAPLLQRIVKPTGTRARIYDKTATLLFDTNWLYSQGQVHRTQIPDVDDTEPGIWSELKKWFRINVLGFNNKAYVDIGNKSGTAYQEVRTALMGTSTQALLMDELGEPVVVVAVPVQHFKAVLGVLLLSTSGQDIAETISKDRRAVMYLSLLAGAVTLLLSLWLTSSIASPMHRLASAAEAVRRSIKTRRQIPDLTNRGDEIGHLSGTIRAMTDALYRRLDAIESFAADVSHELKNPLTSLRSAVETLPLAKNAEDRERLTAVILHDVQRLDRLITDISDASRLDAELALTAYKPVDMAELLSGLVPIFNDMHSQHGLEVSLHIEEYPKHPDAYVINGHDSRLGQVITNLLDNALSFSPQGGEVSVSMRRNNTDVEISVSDEGPGIPPDNLEKIFKRFYTDRPGADNFGRNSGLGLNISRQIVTAHGGKIWAENILEGPEGPEGNEAGNGGPDNIQGARFTIRLPAETELQAGGNSWKIGRN